VFKIFQCQLTYQSGLRFSEDYKNAMPLLASLLTKSKKTIRPQTPTINALIKLIRNLVTKNRIFAPNFQTFL